VGPDARNHGPIRSFVRRFYVRQLKDWTGSAEIEQMIPAGLATYGELCGWTLASYLGPGDAFDRALLEFSTAYAVQNQRDYNKLADAVKAGRIVARTGL